MRAVSKRVQNHPNSITRDKHVVINPSAYARLHACSLVLESKTGGTFNGSKTVIKAIESLEKELEVNLKIQN